MAEEWLGLNAADVRGASLAWREAGSGEPVVFVHGSGCDLRIWENQLPAVAARYRAIALSRRYARPNADIPPGADDPMATHVEDLAAFLRAIGLPSAHLVGHSWGAFIALLAAIEHPEIVRSIVLMEPPLLSLFVSTPPKSAELLRLALSRPRTAAAILRFGALTFEPARRAYLRGDDARALTIFGRGILGRTAFDAVPKAVVQQLRENGAVVRAQITGAGFPPLAGTAVRGVRAPALVLAGKNSPGFLRCLADVLHEFLPVSERIDIPGSSHLMQYGNPEAVNAAILGFLDRVTVR